MTALHHPPSMAASGPHSTVPVPLRVVPSRRSPGPMPAAADLVEPGDPTTGRLIVDTSRSPLSPQLRGRRVAIRIDGRVLRCPWGRQPIDLPPGRHLVEIEVEQVAGWGRATEAVPVAAGHVVEVFYRAPALPRVAGAIGPSAQGTRGVTAVAILGLGLMLAVLGALAGLAVLLGLLPA